MLTLFVFGLTVSIGHANALPASVKFLDEGSVESFDPGTLLFTDRNHRLNPTPEALIYLNFRYSPIGLTALEVTGTGRLLILTPDPAYSNESQAHKLEQLGFQQVIDPDFFHPLLEDRWGDHVARAATTEQAPATFQLFGEDPANQVRLYAKEVVAGDRYSFGSWVVVLGFRERLSIQTPWDQNKGEVLYNGIILPESWPPVIDPADHAPMEVPYLDHRPDVIPIDVGRQLFVDDFLIESTNLRRVFHMPVKYRGNPILKPETELEINATRITTGLRHGRPGTSAATPKSGGVWWDPEDQLFKMWYEAGWINTIAMATSIDGLHWERPDLGVLPGTNRVGPTELSPDS